MPREIQMCGLSDEHRHVARKLGCITGEVVHIFVTDPNEGGVSLRELLKDEIDILEEDPNFPSPKKGDRIK